SLVTPVGGGLETLNVREACGVGVVGAPKLINRVDRNVDVARDLRAASDLDRKDPGWGAHDRPGEESVLSVDVRYCTGYPPDRRRAVGAPATIACRRGCLTLARRFTAARGCMRHGEG